jgi:hypothetical protein
MNCSREVSSFKGWKLAVQCEITAAAQQQTNTARPGKDPRFNALQWPGHLNVVSSKADTDTLQECRTADNQVYWIGPSEIA